MTLLASQARTNRKFMPLEVRLESILCRERRTFVNFQDET